MILSGQKDARKYAPSTAVSIAGYMHTAIEAGHSQPRTWLTAQAQYEDGSPVPGTPAIAYVAPAKAKTPQIPQLPEAPSVVQLGDGSWRKVPQMQVKYSQHGQYYAIAYAFLHRNSPVAGYFEAPTKRDLFDSIFSTKNDAIADGHGGWLDPHNPQIIGEPTLEQTYRATLPLADAAEVQRHLDLIAARDAALAAAEAELNREPTEAEIAAAAVDDRTIAMMPAAVLKDKVLSDKAFAKAYERRERAREAFDRKARQEREAALAELTAKQARERLANRESGGADNTDALQRRHKAEYESLMGQNQ